MATTQEVIDKITEQTTIVGGLKVYNDDLRKKLADALAAGGLTTQAQLDGIFASVASNNQAVADAMVENVPVP